MQWDSCDATKVHLVQAGTGVKPLRLIKQAQQLQRLTWMLSWRPFDQNWAVELFQIHQPPEAARLMWHTALRNRTSFCANMLP